MEHRIERPFQRVVEPDGPGKAVAGAQGKHPENRLVLRQDVDCGRHRAVAAADDNVPDARFARPLDVFAQIGFVVDHLKVVE